MDKSFIVSQIIEHLENELAITITAANQAHNAAIDDQSVAETQYDTLAIEAGYLAEGHSKRVEEIHQAISALKQMPISPYTNTRMIKLGDLVQLSKDVADNQWFFIAPAAGGFRMTVNTFNITVITTHSPMAVALVNQYIEDDVCLSLGNARLDDYISNAL